MIETALKAIQGRHANIMGHEGAFKSAVAVPLILEDGAVKVLFEKRAATLNAQPGEISFPGGKIEPFETPEAAAIRETCEELGLSRDDLDLVGPLDVLLTPFGLIIYPFVCQIRESADFKPNPDEVETAFTVPLSYLMQVRPIKKMVSMKMALPPDYPYELIPQGKDYPWREGYYPQYFYQYQDWVIWGLTARILHHFLHLIKQNQ